MALRGAGRLGLDAISWFANEVGAIPVNYLRCISSAELPEIPQHILFNKVSIPTIAPELPDLSQAPISAVSDFQWKGLAALAIAGGAFWAAHQWANKENKIDEKISDQSDLTIIDTQTLSSIHVDILDIDWDIEVSGQVLSETQNQKTAKAYASSGQPLPDMDISGLSEAMLKVVNQINDMIQVYQPKQQAVAKAHVTSSHETNQQDELLKAANQVAQAVKQTFESLELPMKLEKAVNQLEHSLQRLEASAKQAQKEGKQQNKRAALLPLQSQKPQTTTSHPTKISPQGPKAEENLSDSKKTRKKI